MPKQYAGMKIQAMAVKSTAPTVKKSPLRYHDGLEAELRAFKAFAESLPHLLPEFPIALVFITFVLVPCRGKSQSKTERQ